MTYTMLMKKETLPRYTNEEN